MLQISVGGTNQNPALNMNFTQGDVVAAAFTGTINGTAINLAGSIIKMTIGLTPPLELSTTGGGITITNAGAGQFSVNQTSIQTAALPPGTYAYDLWIESQASPPIETQYITGLITVAPSITVVP